MPYTADFYIKKLQLQPHPEGGYYRENYRSAYQIHGTALPERYNGPRVFSTSIYFLLKKGNVSTFHRLKSDEIWHYYDGDPIKLYLIDRDGKLSTPIVGRQLEGGEEMQLVIPAGSWFAAHVVEGGSFGLVGCSVAPGFDFDDFELANKNDLINKYPQHRNVIQKIMGQ
ncbi:MAG TPA: hypothetical protein DDY13_12700 [Cytophagales bacterium]|jgi:predicted cupin superfamily sugar epimerase|nr:hypothetical protein [Cytophagales bacterium]